MAAGDILIIDSSHVAKTGSDVNYLYFDVLPRLVPGVLVHVHDIGFPFEYPRSWVAEGRSWNEAYLLRAFLTFNSDYRIELWNGCLHALHDDAFAQCPPVRGGSQIWLRRTAGQDGNHGGRRSNDLRPSLAAQAGHAQCPCQRSRRLSSFATSTLSDPKD